MSKLGVVRSAKNRNSGRAAYSSNAAFPRRSSYGRVKEWLTDKAVSSASRSAAQGKVDRATRSRHSLLGRTRKFDRPTTLATGTQRARTRSRTSAAPSARELSLHRYAAEARRREECCRRRTARDSGRLARAASPRRRDKVNCQRPSESVMYSSAPTERPPGPTAYGHCLCAVQDADTEDDLASNRIHDEVRQRGENKFARTLFLSRTAAVRKCPKRGRRVVNTSDQFRRPVGV